MDADNKKSSCYKLSDYLDEGPPLLQLVEIGKYNVAAEYEMEGPVGQLLTDVLLCELDILPEILQDRIEFP